MAPTSTATSALSTELVALIRQIQQSQSGRAGRLDANHQRRAKQLEPEIAEAYRQLLSEAILLSDEQLESVAAGRLDVSTMLIALASTLTVSASGGATLLGTSIGMATIGGGLPSQAIEQVHQVIKDEPWMAPALAIIKEFESLELEAYVDAVGVVTIGWGTTTYNDGRPVKLGERVTPQQADQLLRDQVLRDYAPALFKALPMAVNFTPRQQAALVSFTYNVGVKALNQSTLRQRLLAGEPPALVIRQELPRWRLGDNGEVLAGLERRRAAEVNLFQG